MAAAANRPQEDALVGGNARRGPHNVVDVTTCAEIGGQGRRRDGHVHYRERVADGVGEGDREVGCHHHVVGTKQALA